MNDSGQDVMQLLKESTRALHELAEHHPLQRTLVSGVVDRALYIQFLGQMLHVHEALEGALRAPKYDISPVVQPYHFRRPLIERDLCHFGVDFAAMPAFSGARQVGEEIRESSAECGVAALGFLYVMEGSTNGSRFIARNVERSLNLDRGTGTSYLDPHGDRLRERWAGFRSNMGSLRLTRHEIDAVIRAARRMFEGMIRISDDVADRCALAV